MEDDGNKPSRKLRKREDKENACASDAIKEERSQLILPPPVLKIKKIENEVVIKIPEDLDSILKKKDFWPDVCIYKVPRKLREVNEKAYTPKMISIGPFHHNAHSFKDMEHKKLRYLAEFCKRTGKKWTELADQIKEWEPTIRKCYDHTFELYNEDNAFAHMFLLDSVFIIEFFLKRESRDGSKSGYVMGKPKGESPVEPEVDYIMGKPTRERLILEDLVLLENQVPYFVLESLYQFATGKSDFLSLVRVNLIEYLLPPIVGVYQKQESGDCFSCSYGFSCQKEIEEYHPKHLTDLIRAHRSCKHSVTTENQKLCVKSLYSATKLNEAGVKFKSNNEAWPLDITFEKGELKMPSFEAHHGTERLIRNLMAFEQCHHPNDPYICQYIGILDFLIDSDKDVDLLVENGIVTNLLGENKSVADLVNSLCKEISLPGSCYYDLSIQLNRHYEDPWYHTMAILRSVYFNNLWRGTGTIVALILLVLTLIQSVYSLRNIF